MVIVVWSWGIEATAGTYNIKISIGVNPAITLLLPVKNSLFICGSGGSFSLSQRK
jgi:hypothetical protein